MVWLALSAAAGTDSREEIRDIEDLSLEELLGLRSEVATRSEEEARATAGLVTVLTADDIARAGCRDLLDVLRLIPEIELGADAWNEVGLGVRGHWGIEGKVLVLLDGQVWNELNYGSFTVGNRMPASAIERVEVFRGPGSAIYGGFASLATVQITTRAGSERSGARLDAAASRLDGGAYGRQIAGFGASAPLGRGDRLGVTGWIGRGRRSEDPWVAASGTERAMRDTALDPGLLGADLHVGPLHLHGAAERYHTTHHDGAPGRAEPLHSDFLGAWAQAELSLPLSRATTLLPSVSFVWQSPFRSTEGVPRQSWLYSTDRVDRTSTRIELVSEPSERLSLRAGVEGGLDRGHVPLFQPDWWFDDGQPHRAWTFGAAWGQAIARARPVNLIGGVRLDTHAAYGQAFSPRLGLTRSWERAHLKILASRAFHAPAVVPTRYDVSAERSTTVEIEGGTAIARTTYLTASLYDLWIDAPLVYEVRTDPDTGVELGEGYVNGGRTGTTGGTLNAALRHGPWALDAGYAAHVAHELRDVPYAVPGAPSALLGLPNHKGVLRASTIAADTVSLGAALTGLGPRWSLVDALGEARRERQPPALLVDANVGLRGPRLRGWSVALSVHDLLDASPPFVQPYDGPLGSLPSSGRELMLRIGLDLGATEP